jgi:hypothetical protein
MFKGGGTNMNGIMSDIEETPRRNLAESTGDEGLKSDVRRRLDLLDEIVGGQSPIEDPLTKFLLSFGPSLAKTRPIGSGISGAITTGLAAADEPLKQTFADLQRSRQTKQVLASDILKDLDDDDMDKYEEDVKFIMDAQNLSEEEAKKIVADRYFKKGRTQKTLTEQAQEYVDAGLFDNLDEAKTAVARSDLYRDPDDPGTMKRKATEDRATSFINFTTDIQGKPQLTQDTAFEFVDNLDKLKENDPNSFAMIDTDKYIISRRDTEIRANENGTLEITDPADKDDYNQGEVYYDIRTGKFYSYNGTTFTPIDQT